MSETRLKCERVDDFTKLPSWFTDEQVRSCFLTKIYSCYSSRFNWGDNSSPREYHFVDSIDKLDMIQYAESNRAKGVSFSLIEYPVLALAGTSYEVVLAPAMCGEEKDADVNISKISGYSLIDIASSIANFAVPPVFWTGS